MRLRLQVITAFVALSVIAVGIVWWQASAPVRNSELQDFEVSSSAFVILSKGSTPMLIEVRVQDMEGEPGAGELVDVRNNSGGNPTTCDRDGHASIKVGERKGWFRSSSVARASPQGKISHPKGCQRGDNLETPGKWKMEKARFRKAEG